MNKNFIKKMVMVGIVAIIAGLIYHFKIINYLTLENIKLESERLKLFVVDHYHLSVLLYIIAFIVLLVVAIPSTIPMVLLSGYLFGTFFGALYASIAATIGSVISFLLFRYYIQGFIKERYEHKLLYFKKQMETYGVGYLFVLHYTSIVPFFVINMIAAFSHISLGTFIIVSFVGAFPIYYLFANAGCSLGNINSSGDIFSWPVILTLCFLVGMALASIVIRKVNERRKNKES